MFVFEFSDSTKVCKIFPFLFFSFFFKLSFDSTPKEEQTPPKRQFHSLDPEDRILVKQSVHPTVPLP